jgi:hypothetical protein
MVNPLLDDVKSLLDKDFGDDRILKQICRACENNEVISNYERNYVRKLAEKHLGKKPEFTQTPHVEEKPIVLDVPISQIQQPQSLLTEVPRISYSKSKNKKIMFGIGGLALVIIIAAASFSGFTTGITNIGTSSNDIQISLSIQTDLESYNKKDLISINGVSDSIGSVNLSIENQNNKLVWAEQISLKNGGQFSTLAIAGGDGWEKSGTYTIKVDNGKETKSDTFSFTA